MPKSKAELDLGYLRLAAQLGLLPEDFFALRVDDTPYALPPGMQGSVSARAPVGPAVIGADARMVDMRGATVREVEPTATVALPYGAQAGVGYTAREAKGDGWRDRRGSPLVRFLLPIPGGGLLYQNGVDGPMTSINASSPLAGGLLRLSASNAPRYNDRSAMIQWQRNF